MGVFNQFPYTNWHDLNLDWFIEEFERLQSEWDSFGYTITATAVAGSTPNVEVTGDLINGLNFKFTLVKGDTGATGATGATGNGISSVSIDGSYALTFTFTDGTTYTTPSLKGPQGEGLDILDVYATLADLQTDHPVGNAGDMYLVGTAPNTVLYAWSTANNIWTNVGPLTSPQPSATTPLMDGVADNGLEFAYARGDHRHPSDTSKADLTYVQGVEAAKQDKLVSGTTIKTINSNSVLGSGDISTLQLSQVYPVGSIYMSTIATDPGLLFGFGTWTQIKDMFLLAAGDTYTLGDTGGEATHTLTVAEMPSHTHTASNTNSRFVKYASGNGNIQSASNNNYWLPEMPTLDSTGGDGAHNNMPPYLTVNVWQRVA